MISLKIDLSTEVTVEDWREVAVVDLFVSFTRQH
jgi:hypothetical protein